MCAAQIWKCIWLNLETGAPQNGVNKRKFVSVAWMVGKLQPPQWSMTCLMKGTFQLKPEEVAVLAEEQADLTGDTHVDKDLNKLLCYHQTSLISNLVPICCWWVRVTCKRRNLGNGTVGSNRRLRKGIDDCWRSNDGWSWKFLLNQNPFKKCHSLMNMLMAEMVSEKSIRKRQFSVCCEWCLSIYSLPMSNILKI